MSYFLTHPYSRNVLFPFLMAVAIVTAGSVSTLLYFCSAIALIFINPSGSIKEIALASIKLFQQLPNLWLLPMLFLFVAINSFLTTNIWGAIEVSGSYLHFLFIVPMAVGLVQISPDANFLALFVRGCRSALFFVLPVAAFQLVVLNIRPEVFSGNALIFATITVLASAISILQSAEDEKLPLYLKYSPAILGVSAAILTFSRGIIVVAICAGALSVSYLFQRRLKLKRLIVAGLVSLAVVALLGFALIQNPFVEKQFNKRILSPIVQIQKGKLSDGSFRQRVDMLATGYRAFVERPLVGYGLNNVVQASNGVSQSAIGRQTEYGYTHLHNDYLTHAVGGGIFLLLLFICALFLPAYIADKNLKEPAGIEIRYFSYIISVGCGLTALYGPVFRHDIITTLYSVSLIFVLTAFLQKQLGQSTPRIPIFRKIANGENPYGR